MASQPVTDLTDFDLPQSINADRILIAFFQLLNTYKLHSESLKVAEQSVIYLLIALQFICSLHLLAANSESQGKKNKSLLVN